MKKEPIIVATEYTINISEGAEVVRENGLELAKFYRYEGIIKCGDKTFKVNIKNLIPYLKAKRILVDDAAYWFVYSDCSGYLEIEGIKMAEFDCQTSEVKFFPQDNWEMTGTKDVKSMKEHIRKKLNLQIETNACV